MNIFMRINGKLERLSLENAVKYTLVNDPADVAYNNLIMWQNHAIRTEYNDRGHDIAFLGLMIEKCEKRAEEMGITL